MLTEDHTSSDFLSLCLMSILHLLSCPSRDATLPLVIIVPEAPLWQFLRLSLFLMILMVLRMTGPVLYRMFLMWKGSDTCLKFSHQGRVLGSGEEDHRGQVPSSSPHIKAGLCRMTSCWCWPWFPAEVCLKFPLCGAVPFPWSLWSSLNGSCCV